MQKNVELYPNATYDCKGFRGIGGFTRKNTIKETKTGKLLNDLATYLRGFDRSLQSFPSVIIYTVTPEQENKAIDALKFKEELCGPHGVLLLGKLLDPNGNELEATDSTIIKLAQEQSEASLSYQDEIPWGVCRLLQLFQGTNYQDI